MLRLEPEINEIVFKLKGWHLQRGKRVTNSDVVKELILKDAKRKGINNNYQPNKQLQTDREKTKCCEEK
ncbi:unnamed protein product [marine sediment metagenome]|uniref:Uncharacterized protein n=1 Tax=marine sediment metagenome TaxID=412755 RepID=X0WV72_9ZZZZ